MVKIGRATVRYWVKDLFTYDRHGIYKTVDFRGHIMKSGSLKFIADEYNTYKCIVMDRAKKGEEIPDHPFEVVREER